MTGEMLLFAGALGLSLIYSRRTGWATGGIVTPGFLALHAERPLLLGFFLLLGVVLALPLELLTRRFVLFGRDRIGVAMLLSVLFLAAWNALTPLGVPWYGWVVPGLVAADTQRQGALGTLAGALACGAATLCAGRLFA